MGFIHLTKRWTQSVNPCGNAFDTSRSTVACDLSTLDSRNPPLALNGEKKCDYWRYYKETVSLLSVRPKPLFSEAEWVANLF